MNFLADVGGLFNSLFVIGKIVIDIFIEKLFYSHIMREIYQVDTRTNKSKRKSYEGNVKRQIGNQK